MAEFKKLNGYDVMDETARQSIEALNETVNGFNAEITSLSNEAASIRSEMNIANSAIENLNESIYAADLEMNSCEYIFIGDSYADGYSPDGTNTNWCEHVKANLGINDADYIKKSKGGVGFCNTVDGSNFLTLLSSATPDVNDHVKHIIVCGGYNDRSYTYEAINEAIGDFCDYAKVEYPNAKIHIGMMGFTTNAEDLSKLNTVLMAYSNCGVHGACYMNNIEYALHRISFMASDGYHPNAKGQELLGSYISGYLKGGNINVIDSKYTSMRGSEGVTTSNSFRTSINNGVTYLIMAAQTFSFSSLQNVQASRPNKIPLCVLTDGHVIGGINASNTYNVKPINVLLSTDGTGNYKSVVANIMVIDKIMYLYFNNTTSTAYEEHTFNRIVTEPFVMPFDSMVQGG